MSATRMRMKVRQLSWSGAERRQRVQVLFRSVVLQDPAHMTLDGRRLPLGQISCLPGSSMSLATRVRLRYFFRLIRYFRLLTLLASVALSQINVWPRGRRIWSPEN